MSEDLKNVVRSEIGTNYLFMCEASPFRISYAYLADKLMKQYFGSDSQVQIQIQVQIHIQIHIHLTIFCTP